MSQVPPTSPAAVPPTPAVAISTPTARGQFHQFNLPSCLLHLSGEYTSDEEDFRFFRARNLQDFDSSSDSYHSAISLPNTRCTVPIEKMVYIDDFNCIEKVKISEGISHISTQKRKIDIMAQKSGEIFKKVQVLAANINMKVNANKTQLLCMHSNFNNELQSYITSANGERIYSTDTLKILGFHFNKNPNANFHVEKVIEKFYSKLWALRFLKRSGMKQKGLLDIYNGVLRPSAEYCIVIYNTLIPKYLSDRLEDVQKRAMRIIFGWQVNYAALLEEGKIQSLQSRREQASLKARTSIS